MSDQNTTVTALETNGTNGKERAAHKGMFATLDEANAAQPTGEKSEAWRTYEVSKDGAVIGYTWGRGVYDAVCNAAHDAGYTAGVAEPKKGGGPVTKEKVASRLAEFTDEELAALGLNRKKPTKAQKA